MEKSTVNILHLSDIHFGMDNDRTQIAQRKNALNELLNTLSNLDEKEKPDIIVVSGDITWQGKVEGYSLAKSWLQELLHIVSLDTTDVILCPGNHDMTRNRTIGLGIPSSSSEADSWLSIDNIRNLYGPFNDYVEFCKEFNIVPLKINNKENYLFGTRKLKGINFVVLNSAWFCRNNDDARKLWIGLPQLELMNAEGEIAHYKDRSINSNVAVGVVHHPSAWLNEEEQNSYNERPSTYRYLSERTDLILSGHTHGAYEPATRSFNKAYFISGGAAYSGGRFRNSFSIIRITPEEQTTERVPFEFNPRQNSWDKLKVEKLFFDKSEERSDQVEKIQINSKIWNVPHRRHPFFVGRDAEIQKIKDMFVEHANTQRLIAIHGMGGIGKSQLVIEYAYVKENEYQTVWWIRSDETLTIMADIEALCVKLGLPIRDEKQESIAKEEIFRWMEEKEDWLIIFDNAESQSELANFIPLKHKGHILITTRNPNWLVSMALNLLMSEKSIEFLTKSTGQNDLKAAEELSIALGDLPLALEQASAYIRESGLTLAEYLERFKKFRSQIVSRGKPLNYSSNVATTWEISIQKLCEEFPVANDFMIFCSFLFPELIRKDIFCVSEILPEFLKTSIKTLFEFDDLLTKLRSYSLIQTGNNAFSIHRLIQLIVNDKLTNDEKSNWVSAVAKHLMMLFNRSEDFQISVSDIIPHILNLSSYISEDDEITKDVVEMLNIVYLYYLDFGVFSEAKELAYLIYNYSEKVVSDDKERLLSKSYFNLSNVHLKLGQFIEAKKYILLANNDEFMKPNQKALLLNGLIHIERELGNFSESLSVHLELDELIESNPENFDNVDLGQIANSLGMTLSNMSEYERAEECFKKAIKFWEKAGKNTDQFIALVYSNLGNIYRLTGKNESSRDYYKKAIDINKRLFGEKNISISNDYGNIGLSYYNEYNFFYARRYFRKAMEINNLIFNEVNAHNAILLNNIGMVEEAEENLEKAKRYYEDSLDVFEKLGNYENHDFAITYYNIGGLHQILKDFKSAYYYLNKALEIDRKVYGLNHPEVAKDLGKLGTMMIDQRNIAEAIEYLNEARGIYEFKQLINSPDYVMVLANLSIALYIQGNKKKAKTLLDKSLCISGDIMGENNSQQLIIFSSFKVTLLAEGRLLIELDFLKSLQYKYGLFNKENDHFL